MTILCYRKGILAADTLATVGDAKCFNLRQKIKLIKGGTLGEKEIISISVTGRADQYDDMIQRYESDLMIECSARPIKQTMLLPKNSDRKDFIVWINALYGYQISPPAFKLLVLCRDPKTLKAVAYQVKEDRALGAFKAQEVDGNHHVVTMGSGSMLVDKLSGRMDEESRKRHPLPFIKDPRELAWIAGRLVTYCGGAIQYINVNTEKPEIRYYEPTEARKEALIDILGARLLA